jgi:hypothetical protein
MRHQSPDGLTPERSGSVAATVAGWFKGEVRMGKLHQLVEDNGKKQAMKMVCWRRSDRAVEAASATMLDPMVGEVVNFIYSGWSHAGLPHRRIPDDQAHEVKTEHLTMLIEPGKAMMPDETYRPVGVPYGSLARCILIYLQSRALETGNRTIEVGRNLSEFLKRLGLSQGGKTNKTIRDQIERINHCKITFYLHRKNFRGIHNANLVDTALFFGEEMSEDERQMSLFRETITLGESFFQQLQRHAVPLDEAAVRKLYRSSRSLDLYCFLAFRLHHLAEPTPISWAALRAQFGVDIKNHRHFKHLFQSELEMALSVYPEAKVDVVLDRGIIMHRSPPPMAPWKPKLVVI